MVIPYAKGVTYIVPPDATCIALTLPLGGHEKYSGTRAAKYIPVSATAVGDVPISMKQSVVETTRTTSVLLGRAAVVPAALV
jgi:hypothetical protein